MEPTESAHRKAFFTDQIYPGSWWRWLSALAIGLYIASAIITIWARYTQSQIVKILAALLIGAWTIGPPAWFVFEYFHMRKQRVETVPSVDGFKYSQELARIGG